MAAKPQKKSSDSKKRKRIPNQKSEGAISNTKKPKFASNPKKLEPNSNSVESKGGTKPFKGPKKEHQKPSVKKDGAEDTKKKRRLHAKELAEARKKKRKKHYSLEQVCLTLLTY